jgi:catechol 2,3-dioxygenase-like lactoylglutathione lyase family enzyme
MISKISHVNVWVDDQDEALAFYRDKLGLEVREDVTLPEMNFRWLTVGPAGQPDVAFVLMTVPGPPVFEAETAAQLKDLLAKGALGALFVATDDAQASYEELKARGVEFTSEPTRMPYGIDAPFRDPFGNAFRMVQELDASEG